jgi:hypothetical protein
VTEQKFVDPVQAKENKRRDGYIAKMPCRFFFQFRHHAAPAPDALPFGNAIVSQINLRHLIFTLNM